MLNDKKFRSILCLNGDLPPREFFLRGLPIIAADGALHKLLAINIKPDIVIGDLDSVDESFLLDFPHQHLPDQSSSDFQKCLVYMKAYDLLPAIHVGIHGGFFDHVLNNLNIFVQTESVFYVPPLTGFTIKADQTQRIETEKGIKFSLIAMPSATIQTHGLKWDINNATLNFPGKNSCFNRANETVVDITVKDGCLLVMLYDQFIEDAGWPCKNLVKMS